jgi:hypothetical protein
MINNWHFNFKFILVQVAARNQVNLQQIKIICQKTKKKFNDKLTI